jgi:glycine dehydrogenase subunit 1
MRYIPTTPQERQEMLRACGAESIDALFADIPEEIRAASALGLGPPLAEPDLMSLMRKLAAQNVQGLDRPSFLGAGHYYHHRPSAVDHMMLRSEFFTAYTPYQPELSQGTLQALFEFQTLVCQLTGLDVANASMYDGASAMAEGVLMAVRATGRQRVVASDRLHPHYRGVLETYCRFADIELQWLGHRPDGTTQLEALRADEGLACLVVQSPNFLGVIEPLDQAVSAVRGVRALTVLVSTEPLCWGLLEPPGETGIDIFTAEGQSLSSPPQYGGPNLGLFATRTGLLRRMPGRLVGETLDVHGRRGYVITLSTREQHIRREKATSNICTNQTLFAIGAAIYMSLLGREGLRALAVQNLTLAEYAKAQIASVAGCELPYAGRTFNEFVVKLPVPPETLNQNLLEEGLVGGLPLGPYLPELEDHMLLCTTEMTPKPAIDSLVEVLRRSVKEVRP